MRKLLFLLVLILTSSATFSQTVKFKITNPQTNTNINGGPINKGDEFIVSVHVDGNNNATANAVYYDFEFQNTAFELTEVSHTGTIGNGGVIPNNSQISFSHYSYPGYSWLPNGSNSTTNGNTNYQYANYTYTGGGPKTILRVYINWATPAGSSSLVGAGEMLKLKFRLKADAPGYSWDPIKMNFAAVYNSNGSAGSTIMEQQLTTVVGLDPLATTLLRANLDLNQALTSISPIKVAFIDTLAKSGPLFDVTSNGTVNIDQAQLQPNKIYRVMAMVSMDKLNDIYNAAVTVSDFTTAQAEFVTQNLDGTFKNQNIQTGMGYFAADVNRSKTFDGGDVVKIFSQSVTLGQLVALPQGYTPGSNGFMSVPTFLASDFNNYTTTNWKDITNPSVFVTTNNYGNIIDLNLKYVLWGDINRSHSSQVIDAQGAIKTNAILATNAINTPSSVPTINVNLNNLVVTGNTLELPIVINTNTNKVSALQFEFTYDPTKIKFEELLSNLPNGWFVFGTPRDGKIKFGAVDRELKNSVSGEVTAFKLKFSTLVPGVDLATQVRVTNIMDASDNKGNQLGIDLNTTTIKLTGYNKFN
jgi:hypothetical protein